MNDVSPVTESAVRDFASRILSMIISHSQQAQQIKDLQSLMEQHTSSIHQLRQDAERTARELGEAYQLVTVAEKERDEAKVEASQAKNAATEANDRHRAVVQDFESRIQQAHDSTVQRDQRIAALEQELTAVKAERDRSSAKAEEAENTLSALRNDVTYWTNRCHSAEKENVETLHKFHASVEAKDKAEAILRELQDRVRSLFEPTVKAPEPPVQPVTTAEPVSSWKPAAVPW